MNIIQAINDPNLFQPFLGADLDSWRPWCTALRALYGLPIAARKSTALVRDCTGRDAKKLPATGFDTAAFLTGRRSGKSRIAAVVGAFEAVLAGNERKLAVGEQGIVAVVSPTRRQSRIVRKYLAGVFETPLLRKVVAKETTEGFELTNGVSIEILTGDWRTVRGFSLLAAIVDEAAFFGLDAESRVKSDTELVRALRPALATTGGKLVAISSPYAKRGWTFTTYERHHGNDNGTALVWNCPSRTMNPTLPQRVVDDALAEDPAGARAEYLGEFRDDVGEYLPRHVIQAVVVPGRKELLPRRELRYFAFADLSGGRSDDAALAVAHKVGETVIVDLAKRWKPPFDPRAVIGEMAATLRKYGCAKVTGDNYAAEFVAGAFVANGIRYMKSEQPKAQLYAELLPLLCSREIELPDDAVLIDQLAGLERRTRSGGRDIIDHRPGAKDDLANAVAGVGAASTKRHRHAGALFAQETR